MINEIIPRHKYTASAYVLLTTIVVAAQLFSLDKSVSIEPIGKLTIWVSLLLVANVASILSLPYAIGLLATSNLLVVSRWCVIASPVLWCLVVVISLTNGAILGMLGVYLVWPSLIILPALGGLAWRVFASHKIAA